MRIFAPLLAGIVLVFSLVHKWVHNLAFSKLDMEVKKTRALTTVTMLLVCLFVPFVPAVLLFMGLSVGVVSIMTLGAIGPKSDSVEVIRTEARVVK